MRSNLPRSTVFIAALVLIPSWSFAQASNPVSDAGKRYPNELPGFQFYQTAKWRPLEPMVSTMKDVRAVLGNPDASDLSAYSAPYPGDEKAKKPLFRFMINWRWEVLIYFAQSCSPHGESLEMRVCSIDLIPEKPLPFDSSKLTKAFHKKHVVAVDAAWDEYSDGSGLRYEVYTTYTPYGNNRPGDLNRISYGSADETLPDSK